MSSEIKKHVKVVVACMDEVGNSVLHTCVIEVTYQEFMDKKHHVLAKENATYNSFIEPMVAFTKMDPAGMTLGSVFAWLTGVSWEGVPK